MAGPVPAGGSARASADQVPRTIGRGITGWQGGEPLPRCPPLAACQQQEQGEEPQRQGLEPDAPAHQPVGPRPVPRSAHHADHAGEEDTERGQHGDRRQDGEERDHAIRVVPERPECNAPARIAIIVQLQHRPCCVHELVSALDMPQPAVSQHLRVLKNTGVVKSTQRGREHIYSLVDEHLSGIVNDALSHAEEIVNKRFL